MMKNKVWGETADVRSVLQAILREMMDMHIVVGEMAEILKKICYKEYHEKMDDKMDDWFLFGLGAFYSKFLDDAVGDYSQITLFSNLFIYILIKNRYPLLVKKPYPLLMSFLRENPLFQ